MGYKYKYEDLNCTYCLKKSKNRCKNKLCPHIMGNLSDLFASCKFREAVINADNCKTLHLFTLVHLKEQAAVRGIDISINDKSHEDVTFYDYKPECKGCCYATPGFVCHSKNGGSCLMDWIKEKNYGGCK